MMGIGMAVRPPRQSLTHQALAAIRRAGGTVFLSGLPRNYFDSAGTTPATVDNPVGLVKDSVGSNNASQPTTGSKPTLRRGLVNQLLWSGNFSNAAWTKLGATIAIGKADPFGGTSACKLVESAANTTHYFLQSAVNSFGTASSAWIVKPDGRTKIRIRSEAPQAGFLATNFDLANGTVQAGTGGSIAAIGNGFYLCVATTTVNGTGENGYHLMQTVSDAWAEAYMGDGTSGVIVYRAGLYHGTVTAQQILDAGGIPLTTTAPASSALGKYWWQFDPTAPGDYLQTSITTGNEGWVCAGVTPSDVTASRSVACSGAGNTTAKGVYLYAESGNWIFQVGNGSARQEPGRTAATVSQPVVVSAGWNASTISLDVNAVSLSAARSGDCVGVAPMTLGSYITGTLPFSGGMSVTVICPTLPPPADRALIRKWVGSLQGQTL